MYRFIPQVPLDSCQFLNFRLAVVSEPCPHCQRYGNLKSHGFVRTRTCKETSSASARLRALRFYCSSRRGKNGCGKTFSIHFKNSIPGSSLPAKLISTLLSSFAPKQSHDVKNSPCSRSTHYRWKKRFRLHQWQLRTFSALILPPLRELDPGSAVEMTLLHLKHTFPKTSCLVSDFQVAVQRDFCSLDGRQLPLCQSLIFAFKNLFRVATQNETPQPHRAPIAPRPRSKSSPPRFKYG